MSHSYSFDEQETLITIVPSRISRTAEVYTCMPDMLKKLSKMAESRPDCVQLKQELDGAAFFDVDRSCIHITPKRHMSEEQRLAAAERLARGREKKT